MRLSRADEHPRLLAKCRELLSSERQRRGLPSFGKSTEDGARILTALVVLTAPSEGRDEIDLPDEGRTIKLPRNIRRLKLHLLMEKP